jgi:peptidoglycan/LPS O-acetylase OafA/YrhL
VLAAYVWRSEALCALFSRNIAVLYGLCVIFFGGAAALTLWSPSKDSNAMILGGYTWFDIFYVLVLFLALFHPAGPVGIIGRMKILRYLGRISYCLYIVHAAVLYVLSMWIYSLVMFPMGLRIAMVRPIAIAISLGISNLSWRFFESKLVARGQSHRYLPPPLESRHQSIPQVET